MKNDTLIAYALVNTTLIWPVGSHTIGANFVPTLHRQSERLTFPSFCGQLVKQVSAVKLSL